MIEFLLIVFLIIGIGILILGCCNKWLPVWFCNHFGKWHLQPEKMGFDGCSLHGICPRCGKHVLQDGQGNWF